MALEINFHLIPNTYCLIFGVDIFLSKHRGDMLDDLDLYEIVFYRLTKMLYNRFYIYIY